MQPSSVRTGLRRHPLALVIALALAGAPFAGGPVPAACADTLPVTSCADDGSPGTLRSVVASASDGDTVDMTRLTCGTITLAEGQLETGYLQLLTFAGPGRDKLTISGGGVSPVLYFGAYGLIATTITLQDLTIAHARTIYNSKYERASCISSLSGEVLLERVDVTDCHTYFDRGGIVVGGGAVFAAGLTMIDSTITDSSVRMAGGYDGLARGGGAQAASTVLIRSTISGNAAVGQNASRYAGGGGLFTGSLVMVDSVISGNYCAVTGAGHGAPGGGVYVSGNATLLRSLIANNSADGDGGGLFKGQEANGNRATFTIQSSTIAGNSADGIGGALVSQWPVSIANSTLAGNYSVGGGALMLTPTASSYNSASWSDFESAIVAGNTAGPAAVHATDLASTFDPTVFGAYNFIGDADADITLPPDTLRGDPYLSPLADHGGRSQTMAPMPGSPVIDAGFNPLGFNVDQRGPGYARVYGAAADIGAYEVQPPPAPGSQPPASHAPAIVARDGAPKTLPVTSCADDGSPGTLRAVAAQALDGDTIDMSGLTCSTITLQQGPIAIGVLGPNLLKTITIDGPGPEALTISGNDTFAVFQLGGPDSYRDPGTVTVSNLTVADGAKYDTAACIVGFSEYLVLDHVVASDCHTRNAGGGSRWSGHGGGAVLGHYVQLVDSTLSDSDITAVDRNVASGGGLWAYQATLTNSTISGNSASGPVQTAHLGYQTAGGGVYTWQSVTLTSSTISGNSVAAIEPGQNANGGGAFAHYYTSITGSTFAENGADGAGGGLFMGSARTSYTNDVPMIAPSTKIINSTFAGNSAFAGGAIATESEATILYDSTITLNETSQGGAMMIVSPWSNGYSLYLESTIIAGNVIDGAGGHAADLAASPTVTLAVSGANNLVDTADTNVMLPKDTLNGDPMLLPLADNGGPTWTMALASGSPAIDAGNNVANLSYDQRGAGFARVIGAAADIGAYELQSTPDVIFVSGFDP